MSRAPADAARSIFRDQSQIYLAGVVAFAAGAAAAAGAGVAAAGAGAVAEAASAAGNGTGVFDSVCK